MVSTLAETAPRRAWRDSWAFLQHSRPGVVIIELVLAGFGAMGSDRDPRARVISGIVLALAGFVLLVIVVFGLKLLRVPYRQRDELRASIGGADAALPGVPGWDSKVTGIRWETDPGAPPRTLYYRLYPPANYTYQEAVTAILRTPAQEWTAEATWREASQGDRAHYSLFHYPGFVQDQSEQGLADGSYELLWRQRHGLGWRTLTAPHAFEIAGGVLLNAVEEAPA